LEEIDTEAGDPAQSTNSNVGAHIVNTSTGTGAYAELNVANDTPATTGGTGMRVIALGTGWTTDGGYIQDAGVLEAGANLSNGLSIMSRAASSNIRFYAGDFSNEIMRILSTGSVGIGTTGPSFPLSFGTGAGNKIGLYDAGSGNGYGFGIQSNLLQMFSWGSADDITFGYGNSGSLTRNVTFKGTGNVGIGATGPNFKLDVNGTLGGTFNGTNNGQVLLVYCSGASCTAGNGYYAYGAYAP